jgi:2-C-methyl-D-erythritol 2,4-cyclodiphosphate synthase
MFKTGIGQDSHRILEATEGSQGSAMPSSKPRPLILAGVVLPEAFSLEGNSDSDVVLHAITNALSGISCRPVLGPVADSLCKQGVTDSKAYLALALADVRATGYGITHVSVTLECRRPKLIAHFPAMRAKVAELMGLKPLDVAMTATSGEGLTDFGKGLGIQAFVVVSAIHASMLRT